MLINQNRIAIGVDDDKAGGAIGGFVDLGSECYTFAFKVFLNDSHIIKTIERAGVFIPAGIEGEDVFFKHSLEQADEGIPIFHNEVILLLLASKDGEAEFFVKVLGGLKVFNGQADGKCA